MSTGEVHIELAEGISVAHEAADLRWRVLAYIIDLGLIYGIMLGLLIFLGIPIAFGIGLLSGGVSGNDVLEKLVLGSLVILLLMGILTIYHGYFIYYEFTRSQTPGKRLMGLRVLNLNGGPLTLWQCIIRDMMRYIDAMLVVPGLLSITLTNRRQRLGDLMMGTMVVRCTHTEISHTLFYLSGDDFLHCQESVSLEAVPPDIRDQFLVYAFKRFKRATQSVFAEDEVDKEWLATIREKYVQGMSVEVEPELLLRFFAEQCHQDKSQRRK